MRIKPKEEWHNFDFLIERRLGRIEVAISLNSLVARTFSDYLRARVERDTGIRFKMEADGAWEIVRKYEGVYVAMQAFARENPYVFPNVSAHTDRFDSPYNRIEMYVPIEKFANGQKADGQQLVLPEESVTAEGSVDIMKLSRTLQAEGILVAEEDVKGVISGDEFSRMSVDEIRDYLRGRFKKK